MGICIDLSGTIGRGGCRHQIATARTNQIADQGSGGLNSPLSGALSLRECRPQILSNRKLSCCSHLEKSNMQNYCLISNMRIAVFTQ